MPCGFCGLVMGMDKNAEIKKIITRLFADAGGHLYGGEAVTQLEHGLQCAQVAENEGAPAHLILAALVHDIGHLLHDEFEQAQARGEDRFHENLGADFLAKWFGPQVCEPVRLHVAAKRYLCAADGDYAKGLSAASVHTLRIQGGPMNAREAAEFEAHPYFEAAVQLRRHDDTGKQAGMKTGTLAHFLGYVDRL